MSNGSRSFSFCLNKESPRILIIYYNGIKNIKNTDLYCNNYDIDTNKCVNFNNLLQCKKIKNTDPYNSHTTVTFILEKEVLLKLDG